MTSIKQSHTVHCDERPDLEDVSLLVIHNISLPAGQFGTPYVNDLFMNCLNCDAHPDFESLKGLKVSTHYFIDRRGAVTEYVPLSKRAWHAGKSSYRGRENVNDFSVGIELEGTDHEPYTSSQYNALTDLTLEIMKQYPRITRDRIVGHRDVSPGRKTDPGDSFDWNYFYALL